MELYLPRSEIVRQVCGSLGIQTGSDLALQTGEQTVIAVNQAALKVQQECAWASLQVRDTVDINTEQDTLNYPAGCGPGSIRGLAVYDSTRERYWPIQPQIIPVHADFDQQMAAGGEARASVLGRPRFFEQRSQIKLWPPTDQPYKIRRDFISPVIMATDDAVSAVDAMLVIYMATSLIATQMNDERMASYYLNLYGDRKAALKAWQSEGSTFAISSEADMGEDEALDTSLMPNWDRRPTMPPFSAPG